MKLQLEKIEAELTNKRIALSQVQEQKNHIDNEILILNQRKDRIQNELLKIHQQLEQENAELQSECRIQETVQKIIKSKEQEILQVENQLHHPLLTILLAITKTLPESIVIIISQEYINSNWCNKHQFLYWSSGCIHCYTETSTDYIQPKWSLRDQLMSRYCDYCSTNERWQNFSFFISTNEEDQLLLGTEWKTANCKNICNGCVQNPPCIPLLYKDDIQRNTILKLNCFSYGHPYIMLE